MASVVARANQLKVPQVLKLIRTRQRHVLVLASSEPVREYDKLWSLNKVNTPLNVSGLNTESNLEDCNIQQ